MAANGGSLIQRVRKWGSGEGGRLLSKHLFVLPAHERLKYVCVCVMPNALLCNVEFAQIRPQIVAEPKSHKQKNKNKKKR